MANLVAERNPLPLLGQKRRQGVFEYLSLRFNLGVYTHLHLSLSNEHVGHGVIPGFICVYIYIPLMFEASPSAIFLFELVSATSPRSKDTLLLKYVARYANSGVWQAQSHSYWSETSKSNECWIAGVAGSWYRLGDFRLANGGSCG